MPTKHRGGIGGARSHIFPRNSWLKVGDTLEEAGLPECVHKLWSESYALAFGKIPLQQPALLLALGAPGHLPEPEELGPAAAEAAADVQEMEPDGGAVVVAEGAAAAEPPGNAHCDEIEKWRRDDRQRKAATCVFVRNRSYVQDQVVIKPLVDAQQRMVAEMLKTGSVRYVKQQEASEIREPGSRHFVATDGYDDDTTKAFLLEVTALMTEYSSWSLITAAPLALNDLVFRMYARAGATAVQNLTTSRKKLS